METGNIELTLKVGEQVVIPDRGAFASFPKIRIVEITKDGKSTSTRYWPTNGGIPSTLHTLHIRLLNLQWNGVVVQGEYDDTSKVLKITKGNVDSVTVGIA